MDANLNATSAVKSERRGRVFRKSTGQYFVGSESGVGACSISSKLRKRLVYPTADPSSRRPTVDAVKDIKMVDPVAIGDVVTFTDADQGAGVITEVHPRKNKLSRRAPGPKPLEQVVVANVDQIVAVIAAAQPKPSWNMLDRYLASAEEAGLRAIVCVTKMDLANEPVIYREASVYANLGYPVVFTSAIDGRGIGQLKDDIQGRNSVFVGKSGVGKTTLLNAIQPELGQRVSNVSGSTGKGKHTTSHLEMFPLDFGGSIVDTPGMREFGLWNIRRSEIAGLFPEMRPYLDQCRFGSGCTHTHEPGCAIKQAVEAGKIVKRRYESFLTLR